MTAHRKLAGTTPVRRLLTLALLLTLLLPGAAWAQQAGGLSLPLVVSENAGGSSYSVPVQTLLFFSALTFIPAVLLMMTSFTRIVIVLSLLRQALGTQAAPCSPLFCQSNHFTQLLSLINLLYPFNESGIC